MDNIIINKAIALSHCVDCQSYQDCHVNNVHNEYCSEFQVNLKRVQENIDIDEGNEKVFDAPKAIKTVLDNMTKLLTEKNKRYGNSALEPMNVFSKLDSHSSICIRLDDKLSRIRNSQELRKNDVADLIGYLTLLCVANEWTNFDELID